MKRLPLALASLLLFAVTLWACSLDHPAAVDDTVNYPSTTIETIYAAIEAMTPRPQFVVATGDYMNANPAGSQGAAQIDKYRAAALHYSGPTFAAMGHMDCDGTTGGNCASHATSNSQAFMDGLVKPLGKTLPYYSIPINDVAGRWNAKLLVVACNAWSSAQRNWLAGELARGTTYTFIVRHESSTVINAPCIIEMEAMLLTSGSSYQALISGHSHSYSHFQRELIVGNAGAPLTGNGDFGYATVEQLESGMLVVTQYDYLSSMPIGSFQLP